MIQDPKNKEHVDKLTRQLMEDMKAGKFKLPPKVTERNVPTVFKQIIKVEYFRKFPFWERIRILFGANFVTLTGVAVQHNPGEIQPLTVGSISYRLNATDHMQQVVEQMLEKLPEKPV